MPLFWVEIKESVVGWFGKEKYPVFAIHRQSSDMTFFLVPDDKDNGVWVDSLGCNILQTWRGGETK